MSGQPYATTASLTKFILRGAGRGPKTGLDVLWNKTFLPLLGNEPQFLVCPGVWRSRYIDCVGFGFLSVLGIIY